MGNIRPLLRFENSCIYSASDSSEEHIGTLIIAKPEAGQTVIAASTNSDGRLTDARATTLNANLPFSFIDLDLTPSEDAAETYLYFWNKDRSPVCNRLSPADIAAINE